LVLHAGWSSRGSSKFQVSSIEKAKIRPHVKSEPLKFAPYNLACVIKS